MVLYGGGKIVPHHKRGFWRFFKKIFLTSLKFQIAFKNLVI